MVREGTRHGGVHRTTGSGGVRVCEVALTNVLERLVQLLEALERALDDLQTGSAWALAKMLQR